MVTSATTAPAPKPAVFSVSTTAEPDHASPLAVVSFGIAMPWSLKDTRSVEVARRQAVPAPPAV
jgi:hypothetical protein